MILYEALGFYSLEIMLWVGIIYIFTSMVKENFKKDKK
jgi:hypothetical protein|tara:strand:- start:447 stop:560 length:114 start_codon:yes stop_codon:yes gene_type:complete